MFKLTQSVGKNCPNKPDDVKTLHQKLMEIGKIPCYQCGGVLDDHIINGIKEIQRHFMLNPDGVISIGGRTQTFLSSWKTKPVKVGVQLPGRLKEAWDWVSPLLPEGSYCSSGLRSAEEQRQILQKFYLLTFRSQLITKYGLTTYESMKKNLLANEQQILNMVHGVGQQIAAPGKSMHQQGKAIDVGGPSTIDQTQVDVVKLVACAHSALFTGKVLKERNGCVHFEIH